ncbi:MAG: alpha/beta hydrolase [Acidimicrobiales bacterium]
MNGTKKRFLAVLAVVGLAAAACSGGGGGDEDPTEGALENGERLVTFSGTGGLRLAGTLGVPDNLNGSAPAVVIIPTIAPTTDRDGFQHSTMPDLLYKDLSDAFRAAGMVTLRYDRRGIGASRLESGQRKPTYEEMVGDGAGAVKFLTARKEVGKNPIAVVGHDIGGWSAMKVAATESRVKSLTLVSTPGRPLVDIYADGFKAVYGQGSADRFRASVAELVQNGKLPSPDQIHAQHQGVLGQGQDEWLKGMFAAAPLTDANKVKVPTLVSVGAVSTTVTKVDADMIAQAIGSAAQVVTFAEDATTLRPPQPDTAAIPFNPADESTHLFGARPVVAVPRDAAAVGQVSNFILASLKAAKT